MLKNCALLILLSAFQVALHDSRNLSQRLHVFESHTYEVFQVTSLAQGKLTTYLPHISLLLLAMQYPVLPVMVVCWLLHAN